MVKRTHWGSAVKLPAKRWASPKNVGCARTSRHDHSCVLLRKRRRKSEEKFSVIDTSATIELKTARNTCHLNLIHGSNGASFASKPILESRDGALSQVIAYTVSDVWTCLARTGMKIDGQTPNRVRFGFLACLYFPSSSLPTALFSSVRAKSVIDVVDVVLVGRQLCGSSSCLLSGRLVTRVEITAARTKAPTTTVLRTIFSGRHSKRHTCELHCS